MATVKITDYTGFVPVLSNYLVKKSTHEFIEEVTKKLKKVNKKIAHQIAEDILSRYDIEIIQRVEATQKEPIVVIHYRRKWNPIKKQGKL